MTIALIDYASMAVVYTAMTFLFLDNHSHLLWGYAHSSRLILLGWLFAMAPIGQFFSAPLLGGFSDHCGRKKALLLTTTGTMFSTLLTALAVFYQWLPGLFLSRLLNGLFAGNIAIAQASLADISTGHYRAIHFNFLEIGIGAGLALGPVIGAWFINNTVVSWFSYSTPFYLLTVINLFIIIFLMVAFRESLHVSTPVTIAANYHRIWQHSFRQLINLPKQILLVLSFPKLRLLLLVWLLSMLGYACYGQFFTTFLKERIHFNALQVANLYTLVGIVYLFTQLAIALPVLKHIDVSKLIKPSLLFVGFCIFFMGLAIKPWQVYFFRMSYLIAIVIFMPSFNTVIANKTPLPIQGQVFGMLSSLYAFVTLIIALVGGFLAAKSSVLTVSGGGLLIIIAGLLLVCYFRS